MTIAKPSDKDVVIDLLAQSFQNNKSVQYIIKQDKKKSLRLRRLMGYAFDVCHAFGHVYLTDDKQGCALVLYPEKKRTTFKSIWWDLLLVFRSTGLRNTDKVLSREKAINSFHPKQAFLYLWFIGVAPSQQGKGKGSEMLNAIMKEAEDMQRPLYLETSKEENIAWYQKSGFEVYRELFFGYTLYCLRWQDQISSKR